MVFEASWMKPTTVHPDGGRWGLGWVQGGPFAEDEQYEVSSLFGPRAQLWTPAGYTFLMHGGCDIACFFATNLYALGSGIAHLSYDPNGSGHAIRVTRPNGLSYAYFHMAGPAAVAEGSQVEQGDLLGIAGHSGRADGDHLHLEVSYGGNVDPLPLLRAARDVGEPLPPPVPQAGDPVGFIDSRESLESQYVHGKGALLLPRTLVALPHDVVLFVEGQTNRLIPAGTLVRHYDLYVPVTPDPTLLGK